MREPAPPIPPLLACTRRSAAAGLTAGILSAGVLWPGAAGATVSARPRWAVIYPEMGEPYRTIFLQMVRGINERSPQPCLVWPLPSNASVEQIRAWLQREQISVVIALGRSGLKLAAQLAQRQPVLVGGVVSVTEDDVQGLAVHSLAPDPAMLLARLRQFMPSVRRVLAVHDPRQNAWLMQLARDAARQLRLELIVHDAPDLQAAVRAYQDILPGIHGRRDVIWLPQDTITADDAAILPLLLRESWAQRFALISSGLAPVRRGALLALYPDNIEVGHELAHMAQQAGGTQSLAVGIQPLRQLRTAVNTRTARHLGLDLSALSQRIHLVLPES